MSINHATIGIPTFGQLQTAVKALGYDVFDCIDHAKKAGVADWMDPDALRYAREFVPFIEEVAPKGKLSLGTKVWFKWAIDNLAGSVYNDIRHYPNIIVDNSLRKPIGFVLEDGSISQDAAR